MFYIVTGTGKQVDDSPFGTRAEADVWLFSQHGGVRYFILDEKEADELEASWVVASP